MLLLAAALAQPPVTLFLNDPRAHDSPGDRCVDPHCRALLELLRTAQHSIDFAVYGFRDQSEVIDALLAARERGVAVRGVVDTDIEGVNYYASTAEVMQRLPGIHTDQASDVRIARASRAFIGRPWCDRPAGFEGPLQCLGYDRGDTCLLAAHASREPIEHGAAILHHKFFVIDGHTVWTGSTNVSDSGTGGYNANLVTVVRSPVVASWYLAELEEMHTNDRFHTEKMHRGPHRTQVGTTRIDGWFSPTDTPIRRAVQPLIRRAEHRIDIAVFFLTHKGITEDLLAAHDRGVKVRVLLDATAAKNGYSKHELLRAAGIPVKVEDWGGKMHAKAASFDGQHLVVGSMNWTSAGESGNDENTLVLHDATLAAQFDVWFQELWDDVDDRWLTDRPDPESQNSRTACTDGVDNDFDGLADAADPGCSANPPALPGLPPYRFVEKAAGEGVLLKGWRSEDGPVYAWPGHPAYRSVPAGHSWWCTSRDARAAGFKPAPR